MSDTSKKIISEITRSLVLLGADANLLSIVQSWKDTLSDEEILSLLIDANEALTASVVNRFAESQRVKQ